jgi:hypothetical protein
MKEGYNGRQKVQNDKQWLAEHYTENYGFELYYPHWKP